MDGFKIDLNIVIRIVIILSVAFLASRVVKIVVNRFIRRSSAVLKIDRTRYNFFKNSLNALIYSLATIAVIHSIPQLRAVSVSLLAGAGIFAAVLGFASQQAFSNIISGVFVVLSRPFRVGDVIRIGQGSGPVDFVGTVEDITLRHTVIRDFENRRIIIPNSTVNMETIVNNNIIDDKVRRNINISISYESSIDKAMEIIRDEAMKHPHCIDNRNADQKERNEPIVDIRVIELSDFAVKLRAYVWARNFDDAFDMHTDLNKSIKERFEKEGIEIPYPHRTLVYKKDLQNKS